MSDSLITKNTITIDAPASDVWDALVNPVKTKQYMFGCEPITDWQPGSSLLWKGVFDGKELIAVKGEIKEIKPGKYLAYTVIDPNSTTIPDIPENYLTVTYDLKEQGGQTQLTVTQGDYAKVAEGQSRYDHTMQEGGWDPILVQIKKVAEAGS